MDSSEQYGGQLYDKDLQCSNIYDVNITAFVAPPINLLVGVVGLEPTGCITPSDFKSGA